MEPQNDEQLQRCADLLVQKGFARGHVTRTKDDSFHIRWTQDGKALQKLLWRLFEPPNVRLSNRDIAALILLIIATEPCETPPELT